ncbi:MAG: GNAT family N-acetyltransferase [Gemmatimonadota bacterium]
MSAFAVRAAVPADIDAIGRLGALLVAEHHDFDRLRFIPATAETARGYGAYLGTQLAEPQVVVLVAEDSGQVVGYAYAGLEGHDYMQLRGPAGALYDIVVEPRSRGRGIGRALLDRVLEELAARGAPRIVLSTAAPNEAAQRIFTRAGFRRTMIEMTRELDE